MIRRKAFFIFIAISTLGFSQNQYINIHPTGQLSMGEKLLNENRVNSNSFTNKPESEQNKIELNLLQKKESAVSTWTNFTSSSNVYGVLNSLSKPLQWNYNLEALTFVHNKSNTYNSLPNNNNGSVVSMISKNYGLNWDSLCIWSNANEYSKYPQGGILNTPGNTDVNNGLAYMVGCGSSVNSNSISGNWYASKKLLASSYNNTASPIPGAMQFYANTPPYTSLGKHDNSYGSFTSTDDGYVRSLATIVNDVNAVTTAAYAMRGARVIKGSVSSGIVSWVSDSIIPSTIIRSDGSKQLADKVMMAWNSGGYFGYLVFIGASQSSSLSNRGWQPIVYKTTNSGATWSLINGIDFNLPVYNSVKDKLKAVNSNSNLVIPHFNLNEGIGVSVDQNGSLHIFTSLVGTSKTHDDSLDYVYQFGSEKYLWPHKPGARPYLYDFYTNGPSSWSFQLVDSLATEAPSSYSTGAGYADNPWDIDINNANRKVKSDARLQLSTNSDGYLNLYSWSESDTLLTSGNKKWNTLPNVKARLSYYGFNTGNSLNEINITNPVVNADLNVANKAMFHYSCPTIRTSSCSINIASIYLPLTITNSNPYAQGNNNKHWYNPSLLTFSFVAGPYSFGCGNFVVNSNKTEFTGANIEVFPNPSTNLIHFKLESECSLMNKILTFTLQDIFGKELYSSQSIGKSESPIMDLSILSKGIYFLRVESGSELLTVKKIIKN